MRYNEAGTWKRGVVFIKEIVPKWALTFVANTVYREHYETLPMSYQWIVKKDHQKIEYRWIKKNKEQYLSVVASPTPTPIETGTEASFITEHYWGYTRVNETLTYEYEVTHPTWEQYAIENYEVEVDFGLVYGDAFGFLNSEMPASIMLAEGSPITVEQKRSLHS